MVDDNRKPRTATAARCWLFWDSSEVDPREKPPNFAASRFTGLGIQVVVS